MESPHTPREEPQRTDLEAKTLAWLELKHEMEKLHARIEYVRLILRLGVRQP